ncbi:MAG: hypothetical protein AAF213_02355 [Pseudomonadota bacterium]
MSQMSPSPQHDQQPPSIGQQIGVFRSVYGAADEKHWHDCFHILFGRGISYADEGAVSIAEQAFTNTLMGMPYQPKAAAMMYAQDYAHDYGLPTPELTKRMETIGQIGIDAAHRLKAHWGNLPALHDHQDFWARTLPAGWTLTLPSIAGPKEPEHFIDRTALTAMVTRTEPVTKADRKALLRPLADLPPAIANDTGMGAPAIAVNPDWRGPGAKSDATPKGALRPSSSPPKLGG